MPAGAYLLDDGASSEMKGMAKHRGIVLISVVRRPNAAEAYVSTWCASSSHCTHMLKEEISCSMKKNLMLHEEFVVLSQSVSWGTSHQCAYSAENICCEEPCRVCCRLAGNLNPLLYMLCGYAAGRTEQPAVRSSPLQQAWMSL